MDPIHSVMRKLLNTDDCYVEMDDTELIIDGYVDITASEREALLALVSPDRRGRHAPLQAP